MHCTKIQEQEISCGDFQQLGTCLVFLPRVTRGFYFHEIAKLNFFASKESQQTVHVSSHFIKNARHDCIEKKGTPSTT